jgi:hypothetical protein
MMGTTTVSDDSFAISGAPIESQFPARDDPSGPSRSILRGCEVIREILESLETLTAAGQRHSMGKVVAFIREQLERSPVAMNARNRETVAVMLERLTHESSRPWLDVRAVRERTEALLALVLAIRG